MGCGDGVWSEPYEDLAGRVCWTGKQKYTRMTTPVSQEEPPPPPKSVFAMGMFTRF